VLVKSITEKVDADILAKALLADKLISGIFSRAKIIETTSELFSIANMRMAIGNPPGKNSSIGDAINWTILLSNVPNKEPLHIISEDGDFYSSLNEDAVHPFLEEEWRRRKESPLYVYRTLSAFMKVHFDGVAFTFDKTKEALIDDLVTAGSFATIHQLIAKLETYSYFSLKEVECILAAAVENQQFGWIVTDKDVSDFLNRVAISRMASITVPEQRELLQKVSAEQKERAAKEVPMQFDAAIVAQTFRRAEAELDADCGAAVEIEDTFFLQRRAQQSPDSHLALCNLIGYILSGDPWIQTQGARKVF
jgi:hypothetical protein